MRGVCIEYLHYITEAINDGSFAFNSRLEEIATKEDISNEEYCQIYEQALLAYKITNNI